MRFKKFDNVKFNDNNTLVGVPNEYGDYLYLLAPPEKAGALDRFFVDMHAVPAPDPHLLGDFMMTGDVTLRDVADIYGINVAVGDAHLTLADYFDIHLDHAPRVGATLPLDSIVLVARHIGGARVNVVGLRLPEDEEVSAPPPSRRVVAKRKLARAWSWLIGA